MRLSWISAARVLCIFCPIGLSAQSSSPGPLIEQARALASAGQIERANQMLTGVVRLQPENLAAWQEPRRNPTKTAIERGCDGLV